VLPYGYVNAADARKHIGRAVRRKNLDPADAGVAITVPEDVSAVPIEGERIETRNLQLTGKIVGTGQKCDARLNVSLGGGQAEQTVKFRQAMEPSTSNWSYADPGCCLPEGGRSPLCAESDSMIVSFYETHAEFTSNVQHGLHVNEDLVCEAPDSNEKLARGSVQLNLGSESRLTGSSDGWNVVKVRSLDTVCESRRRIWSRTRKRERVVLSLTTPFEFPVEGRVWPTWTFWPNASVYIEMARSLTPTNENSYGIRLAAGPMVGYYHQVYLPPSGSTPLQEGDVRHLGLLFEMDVQVRFRQFSVVRPSLSIGLRAGFTSYSNVNSTATDYAGVAGFPARLRISFSPFKHAAALEVGAAYEYLPASTYRYTAVSGAVDGDHSWAVTFNAGIAYEY
jgi:hypothetical protein